MSLPLLKIENLSIAFGQNNQVVKNLSYEVGLGETVGIVGESGSGKSVSSLSIMQLLHPNAKIANGKISFLQNDKLQDLSSFTERQMQKVRGKEISMIFQEPMTSLNPVIKCGEQVAEAIRLHKGLSKSEAREEVIDWFNEVQLPRAEQIYDSYPHQLSGGQKQRVMIAMAMCCEPRLLIADEPTTALDVTVQKRILELIKDLQKRYQMSVIFITHDLGVVSEISDRIIVMKDGELVEQGECLKVLNQPAHPYTKGLIACRPPLEHRYIKLPTVKDFLALKEDEDPSKLMIKISESDNNARLEQLFKQDKILQVNQLKTYFPIKKGILRKEVDHVKAVDNVSFDVFEGETLGLVGESGCGKTTLGRSILNLITPTSGQVLYKGQDLTKLSQKELRSYRKDLQIIFQDPYSSLNPRMRVGDAILEPMKVHSIGSNDKDRKEQVIDLMETVGLKADQFERYPHEFSGGQRQRVCIARCLSLSPKFIVCDESVSALDVSVQAQVLNLLNDLKKRFSFTYIFISHDLSVVKYMSDRMLVMKEGKVIESGIAEHIYNKPKSEYTQKLIDSIPKMKSELAV